MKILNGTYTLPLSLIETPFYQEVTATTGGTSGVITCIRMSNSGEIQYRISYSSGAEPTIVVYKNGAWIADAWRTLTFNNQEVSEEFYWWVNNKAKIDGTFALNNSLNFSPFEPPIEPYIWGTIPIHEEAVTFTSNGQTFNTFKVCHYYMEIVLYYECIPMYDDTATMYQRYDENSGNDLYLSWYDKAYRTVIFDNQYVSADFYNWFMSNAILEEVYTIRKSTLKEIADAIRSKKGTTAALPVTEFAAEIRNI